MQNQIKSRKTSSKPIIWVSSPEAHFVSPMAESHPSKEEGKESQRMLEVEEEGQRIDGIIFVLPDEAELLELSEIKEKLLKEDELNQEI